MSFFLQEWLAAVISLIAAVSVLVQIIIVGAGAVITMWCAKEEKWFSAAFCGLITLFFALVWLGVV